MKNQSQQPKTQRAKQRHRRASHKAPSYAKRQIRREEARIPKKSITEEG